MSLAQILYPNPGERGLEEWLHSHALHHIAIVDALREAKGIIVPSLVLYPVFKQDMQGWVRLHQEMHNDMTSALGIPGTDLTGIDFQDKDKSKRDDWIYTHFLQHQGVAELCGQPI